MKKSLGIALCLVVFALGLLAMRPSVPPVRVNAGTFHVYHPTVFVFHLRIYPVVGKPTISASFINRVLSAYGSPAAGKGQALYDLGVTYGIDPVYALAFFGHESRFGTTGEARKSLSLGNERCIVDRPCIDQNQGGYAQMFSWEDGFVHWYHLIKYGYVEGQVTIPLVGHVCLTVDQIIPVYAPRSDHNDVQGYIAAVKQAVDALRKGEVQV